MKKAKKGLLSVLGFAVGAVAALGAVWTVGAKDADPVEASAAAVAWDSWDGTAASGFAYGSGTSSSPYVIETAEQLAYLAQSVNSGNSYSGKYISLESNIDLCNINWTPIGRGSISDGVDMTSTAFSTDEEAAAFCGKRRSGAGVLGWCLVPGGKADEQNRGKSKQNADSFDVCRCFRSFARLF